jgi:hypothetical protein
MKVCQEQHPEVHILACIFLKAGLVKAGAFGFVVVQSWPKNVDMMF